MGDRFQAAYDEHHIRLFRLAYLLTADRWLAEDFVQDAFVNAGHRLTELGQDEWGPYLRTVVMNLWRRNARRRFLEQRMGKARDPETFTLPGPEERDEIWGLILKLPPRQRACVVLRYYEDLSDGEIADVLGCSSGTVKSQSSRALAKLRKELGSSEH